MKTTRKQITIQTMTRKQLRDWKKRLKRRNERTSRAYCKRQEFMSPEQEQAEVCKLRLWNDQIEFNIFHCAVCGKSVCECRDEEEKEEQQQTS